VKSGVGLVVALVEVEFVIGLSEEERPKEMGLVVVALAEVVEFVIGLSKEERPKEIGFVVVAIVEVVEFINGLSKEEAIGIAVVALAEVIDASGEAFDANEKTGAGESAKGFDLASVTALGVGDEIVADDFASKSLEEATLEEREKFKDLSSEKKVPVRSIGSKTDFFGGKVDEDDDDDDDDAGLATDSALHCETESSNSFTLSVSRTISDSFCIARCQRWK
jgi:hypothetical protein